MNVAIAKISVVMTLFNAERFLNEAIDSFLAQDYGNIELVAVINGISSDRTEEIVMEYARKDPRVTPIEHKVSGRAICDG
ncbi:MAG: glycosyltransferase, partial [Chlorobiaceae bacterium]|nr:glycosyltransferase [Chlorobiaceae bacterium]